MPEPIPSSYWIESTPESAFPPLEEPLSVDVAVLGGGIAGITAALLLKEAGKTVALLESKRILHGATGYTTAKLTSGHNLIYAHVERRFSPQSARLYADANEAAIEHVARVASERGIACDFERASNYVYTESAEDVEKVREEADAARRAGLGAVFTDETPLPFPVAGAVRLDEQAQFHPRKYLLSLAQAVPGDGSHVFEQTRALDVKGDEPCRVETARAEITARDVIVATHLSILDRGLFFARTAPKRSYVLGIPRDAAQVPEGMFISTEQPIHSIRSAPYEGRRLLLVGGEGHKTGQEEDTRRRYDRLETWAKARFGSEQVEYRWSTHDNYSVDRLPYVGRLTPRSQHLYVATGFNGWGMSNGTAAAILLTDLILGRPNRWAEVYDASRVKPLASAPRLVKENANVAWRWLTDRRRGHVRPAGELAPGEGGIVQLDGKRVAASRDEEGRLHALSPACTHLGCTVAWNTAERTWDCPCHGSRFDSEGNVIQGPAVRDLERRA